MSLWVFLGFSVLAASSGALFPPDDWYEGLNKPSWRPPRIVFPIVWSVLYVLIAVAAWRIFEATRGAERAVLVAVYGIQLALNGTWSALFFGLRLMRVAFVDLVLLWLSVLAMILLFAEHDTLAALLLAPYLVWVTAAGALNLAMIRLNPAETG